MAPRERGASWGCRRVATQALPLVFLAGFVVHVTRTLWGSVAMQGLREAEVDRPQGAAAVVEEARGEARHAPGAASAPRPPTVADCLWSLKGAILDTIGRAIGCEGRSGGAPKPQHVVYMDPALHNNIGDNLINIGEKMLLEECALTDDVEKIVCCIEVNCLRAGIYPNCSRENLVNRGWQEGPGGTGVVLYHGGGNWGDLYHWIQRGRIETLLMVGRHFPAVQFVSLPQSFFYKDAKKRDSDAKDINEALRLFKVPPVFFWRDRPSVAMAQKLYTGCENVLVPDIVFMLGPLEPALESPPLDVLVSMRKEESVKGFAGNKQIVEKTMETLPQATYWTVRGWEEAYIVTRDQRFSGAKKKSNTYDWEFCVQIARNFLSQARSVIADKLHIAVSALLLGKPMYFVDNVYNKTSNVLDAAFSFAPSTCSSFEGKPKHATSFDVAVERWAAEYRRSAH